MTWASMEGAPKDGTRVLLYARSTLDPHHQYELVVGRWDNSLTQWKVATEYLAQAGELVPAYWMVIPRLP